MISLNSEQEKAVKHSGSSLLIVAGAGTGKTRVLVEKIIHLLKQDISSRNILALTFTNKAADEMRNRVSQTEHSIPFIGTFHSWCAQTLRKFHTAANINENFIIGDRDQTKRILRKILKEQSITDVSASVMQAEISKYKTNLIEETENIKNVLPYYIKALEEENMLDFDDLICKTISLLKKDRSVREKLQSNYKYILVDEYQDTDELQNTLLSLIKSKDSHIVAVGDTDQTIYSWRGASVHNMLSFVETFSPAETVFLTQNYRSTATILSAANSVIEKNIFRHEKEIISTKKGGERITILSARNEDEEAYEIAQRIISLNEQGVSFDDISILFRANFQARVLETTMITNNIPYIVLGVRFFDRAEIKGIISYLTLLVQPNSKEAYTRASSIPRRGIGKMTLEKVFSGNKNLLSMAAKRKIETFDNDLLSLRTQMQKSTLTEIIESIIKLTDYETYIKQTFDNPPERLKEVRELIAFSKRFTDIPCHTAIQSFLEEVALGSDQDSLRTNSKKGVKLMTVHAAKGLEFPYVFVSGLEQGLFPFTQDDFEEHDDEEERRLFYVAITRAKNKLFCTYAQRRGFFGTYKNSSPSNFLYDIPEDMTDSYEKGEDIEW